MDVCGGWWMFTDYLSTYTSIDGTDVNSKRSMRTDWFFILPFIGSSLFIDSCGCQRTHLRSMTETFQSDATIATRLLARPIIGSLPTKRMSFASFNATMRLLTNCFKLYLFLEFLALLLSSAVIIIGVVMVSSCMHRNLTSLQIAKLFSTDKCLSAKHYLHSAVCSPFNSIHNRGGSDSFGLGAWRNQII